MDTQSVLSILNLIFAGSPLSEVLTIIASLVESQGDGMFCTIWLPDEDGKHLRCAAAPSLPDFATQVGPMAVSPKGASCGTAVYRREPVYATDILTDPIWDDYRHLVLPYGIRSVWSRPLFASDGKTLGTFAILYREVRSPGTTDLTLIESASHITGIAIERHISEEALRHERDRLRLLPAADGGQLRVTTLYNPEARGAIPDGTLVPVKGSPCGKAFRTGRRQHVDN